MAVVYYTDGSCVRNGKRNSYGGCAFWVDDDWCENWSDPVSIKQSFLYIHRKYLTTYEIFRRAQAPIRQLN